MNHGLTGPAAKPVYIANMTPERCDVGEIGDKVIQLIFVKAKIELYFCPCNARLGSAVA